MIFSVPTRHEELTLLIKVRTFEPQKIRIKVIDAEQPNTAFTDRYRTVDGESIFFVRMPISPNEALVYVFNEKNGNLQVGEDPSIEVLSITKEPLEKKLDVIDFTNLNGITVVESTPKNFGGKSTSTVDLLMFLFFNSTTKTKTNSKKSFTT